MTAATLTEDQARLLRIGSLFSGAGGLDMAVEQVFGGHTVWHAEIDDAASKVLAHRWPGVPNLGDITTVDWSTVEAIDVLCGGFPCQDVSPAGRRAGLKDGTRSGLWAMFAGAIAALRPKAVVIENVRGLLSADGEEWPAELVAADVEVQRLRRVVRLINCKIDRALREGWWHGEYKHRKQFQLHRMARLRDRALARFRTLRRRLVQRAIGTVIADLANLGYDAQWVVIPASSVGAPHKRERIFILAHPAGQPWRFDNGDQLRAGWGAQRPGAHTGAGVTADADNTTADGKWTREEPRERGADVADAACGCGTDVEGRGGAPGQHGSTEFGAGDRDRERSASARGEFVGRAATELATIDLLPTPAASRSGNNHSPSPGAAVRPSLDSITELLPTPSVADSQGGHLTRSGSRSDELLLPGVARAYGNGELLPTPTTRDFKGGNTTVRDGNGGRRPVTVEDTTRARGDGGASDLATVACLLPTPASADGDRGPDFARADRDGSGGDDLVTLCAKATRDTQWGKYAPAIERWEALTRPAPSPTEPNSRGNPRLAPAFPEWMQGWPDGWVTHLIKGDHHRSLKRPVVEYISRNDALRIIGNGVCPQQAIAALRWLLTVSAVAA